MRTARAPSAGGEVGQLVAERGAGGGQVPAQLGGLVAQVAAHLAQAVLAARARARALPRHVARAGHGRAQAARLRAQGSQLSGCCSASAAHFAWR